MTYVLIGLAIGLMMGITGAGGAIISIPLFQLAMSSSLKEATVLSLVTVLFGTGVNLVTRLREVNWKIVITFATAGGLANYLAMPVKEMMPETVITVLLVMIGIYSILSVWRRRNVASEKKNPHFISVIAIGFFLGLVTTFTGLGGGVLLIPILLRFFGMTYEKALPTSLASILFISLSALGVQFGIASQLITWKETLFLGVGATLAYTILTMLLRSLSDGQKLMLRRLVFTIVSVASLAIVIMKTI